MITDKSCNVENQKSDINEEWRRWYGLVVYPLKCVDVPHMSCENEESEMKEISVVSHGSLEQKVWRIHTKWNIE